MCADAVIVLEAVRRTSGFFLWILWPSLGCTHMVSRCSTHFFKKMMTMTIRHTCSNFYFKAVSEQYLENVFRYTGIDFRYTGIDRKIYLKKNIFWVSCLFCVPRWYVHHYFRRGEAACHSSFLMASFRIFWSGIMYQWWRTKCKQGLRYWSCCFWHGWDFYEDRLNIFVAHHHSSTPFLQIFCLFCFFSLDSQSEAPLLKSRDGKSRKSESLIIAMLTDQGVIGGQITCTSGY